MRCEITFVCAAAENRDRRQPLENGERKSEKIGMTDMEAENTVRNIVWQNCNGGKMPELDTELKDLNLDSLSFIAVIVGLEEAFGFEFKDEELNVYGYRTVRDLLSRVQKSREDITCII